MSGHDDEAFAAKLRGFGPAGIAAALLVTLFGPLFEPFNIIPALLWVHLSRTPWRELGLARPKSWARTATIGIAAGFALKIAMKSAIMPFCGAPVINAEYHYLEGNLPGTLSFLVVAIVGAGFGEELVFRGFLFERLGKVFGPGLGSKAAILVATSLFFGAVHYPAHGIYTALQAVMTGFVFGTIFALTGDLWVPVFAHAAFDVTAVLIIYFGLEEKVAALFHLGG